MNNTELLKWHALKCNLKINDHYYQYHRPSKLTALTKTFSVWFQKNLYPHHIGNWKERGEGVLFSRSFNSRKFKRPCFLIIHNKKTRFQYQSRYIVFGNCRGTGGILWLFPSMVERWIFWNHSIRGPNSPPEKHLKCHNKMAGNISVARFHLTFQDGGEHIS